jgi:CheY-like chemotaxis protein
MATREGRSRALLHCIAIPAHATQRYKSFDVRISLVFKAPRRVAGAVGSVPHNVLLISDAADAKVVRDALINSNDGPFNVDWVRSRGDAVRRLAKERISRPRRNGEGLPRQNPDNSVVAVLVDLFLPDSSGLETFVQVFRAAPRIPILVLSTDRPLGIARGLPPSARLAVLRHGADPHRDQRFRAAAAGEGFRDQPARDSR